MASRRKKRKKSRPSILGHELEVQHRGAILIAGPKDREREIRSTLEEQIKAFLIKACPIRFGSPNNPLPGNIAFEIAWNKPFRVATNELVIIKSLHVDYRNRREWRQWIRVRDGKDEGRPGKPAR